MSRPDIMGCNGELDIATTIHPRATGAGYGWIIDKDHISPQGSKYANDNSEGTIGPRNILPSIKRRLERGEGEAFRMFDDDGELYYTGRIFHHPDFDGCDGGFEPMDDFGMPNAGCTEIQYQHKTTGKWETL